MSGQCGEAEDGTCSHAQPGEVEWVLEAMQQGSGRTRNKSQVV